MSRKDDLKFSERHSKGSAVRHKEDIYRDEMDAESTPDPLSLADSLAEAARNWRIARDATLQCPELLLSSMPHKESKAAQLCAEADSREQEMWVALAAWDAARKGR